MLDFFNLKSRVYVITGGAGQLGMKHAEALLENGGIPVLLDVNPKVGEQATKLSKKYNTQVLGVIVDIANEEAIKNGLEKILAIHPRIYGLINNAANNPVRGSTTQKNISRGNIESVVRDEWDADIAVGLTGAMLMSRSFGEHMEKNGEGIILNIASDLAVIAPDQRLYKKEDDTRSTQSFKPVSYSVVKHGLIGLTKYLATYYAEVGIRVNAISPGGVRNDSIDHAFVKKISSLIPMNRMAEVDDITGAVVFLCSDASSYMTGTNIIIDGGRSIW